MARIRSIKPETWSDQKLARLSRDARLLYISLWNFADEQGRMVGDPRQVKGMCLPMDDDLTPVEVDLLLEELAKAGRVCRYLVDDEHFLFLPNLSKHQRLDAGQASRFPEPPDDDSAPTPQNSGDSPDKSGEVSGESGEVPGDPGEVQPRARAYVAGSREHVAGVPPSAGQPVTVLPTAQTLVAAYVDGYRGRAGHDPPSDIKGQLAKQLRQLLEDGVPYDTVQAGLVEWFEADTHPRTLASFVEVAGRGGRPRGRPTRPQQQREQIVETDQVLDRWAKGGSGGPQRVEDDRRQPRSQLPRPRTPS